MIVKVDTTTICGTDLHILKGDVPAVTKGRILGHEGVGTITEIGSSVTSLKVGDRVIISCIKSCGPAPTATGLYSHCLGDEGTSGIGWVFGHLIDGTQAEFVRVPYAENSLHLLPEGVSDEQAVMLSDILPTGLRSACSTAGSSPATRSPSSAPARWDSPRSPPPASTAPPRSSPSTSTRTGSRQSREFGATDVVLSADADWKEQVMALTDGQGVDVAIEAVGIPATFNMCTEHRAPRRHVANVGVHGKPVELPVEDLWIRNINISMGLVNTNTTPMLLKLVAQHKIPADKFATHHFTFDQIMEAYDTFAAPRRRRPSRS